MRRLVFVSVFALIAAVIGLSSFDNGSAAQQEKGKQRIYELRTYHVLPGRMPAMLKRFREHTTELFEKHGMENVGYWTPVDKEGETRLIYLLAHNGPEAAKKSWQGFRDDPVWHKARDASEADGKIVEKVESVFLKPTDFSKLK
ncbi:MAG: NIPSNAP family protein [Pirellulales bacterium]